MKKAQITVWMIIGIILVLIFGTLIAINQLVYSDMRIMAGKSLKKTEVFQTESGESCVRTTSDIEGWEMNLIKGGEHKLIDGNEVYNFILRNTQMNINEDAYLCEIEINSKENWYLFRGGVNKHGNILIDIIEVCSNSCKIVVKQARL